MSQRGTAPWPVRLRRFLGILPLALIVALAVPSSNTARLSAQGSDTYRNPLPLRIPDDGMVESCADPSVIRGQESGDQYWYMYCTADPLNDEDRNDEGGYNFRLIPMLRSSDLVNWTYVGDAFSSRPSYATPDAGLFAPEIEYYPETGRYHLYFTVTNTTFEGEGSAIGVAWSDNPTGPWTQSNTPVIEPHPADCCPGSRRWVFDPEVFRTNGLDYIYYGSYFGGISVRVLSEDGLTSVPATQTNVAVANKFEGAEVVFRDGYYYLFVSATDCCRGPLAGYSVFVGRSTSPTGPFVDRSGVDLNENEGPNEADPTTGRVGGSPVLTMNGNRWVGPGHNTVFQDFDGQWWTVYHAINRFDPYFEDGVNIFGGACEPEEPPAEGEPCGDLNKRPAMLDPIDWVDGWPMVNGGRGPSDTRQPAPAAQPGEETDYVTRVLPQDRPGTPIAELSDEFNSDDLGRQWSWVREPSADTYGVENGTFRFDTQDADLFVGNNSASVLTEPAPHGDYMVEARVRLNVPEEGCCFNFRQAGVVIYGDDDNYVKLTHVSIFNTRQTEFAKELAPVPPGYPRYGNTVVGPPAEWTYLRIVKRAPSTRGGEERYTAYTSIDGEMWERGGTWTHKLTTNARIGLVSMGGPDFVANFDYVRVYRLACPRGYEGDETCGDADETRFATTLTGAEEVNSEGSPNQGDSDGQGFAFISLPADRNEVCFGVMAEDIELPVMAAHIHEAPAGQNGPVVVPLLTEPDEDGFFSGCVAASATQIEEIRTDPSSYYVNVHNQEFPGGAVRGQLEMSPTASSHGMPHVVYLPVVKP